MEVEALITQLERLLAEARPVPLSASVMVSRRDFDEVLTDLRTQLPEELRQSRWVIKERDELLAQAARESEQILADARAEREHLLSETEVVRTANREAERVVDEAREQTRTMRLEAEDYIDAKLANFEVVLQKTVRAVEKGRERLRGRLAADELADPAAQPADADADGRARPERAPTDDDPYTTGEFVQTQFYDHEGGR